MTTLDDTTVEEILEALGIQVTDQQGSEIQARCVAHKERTGKEDRNPSWYINTESGKHICFSCGFKGSLEGLIVYVKGYDLDAAKAYVQGRQQEINASALLARLDRVAAMDMTVDKVKPLPESKLALFEAPPAWALKSRGLTAEACEQYGVLWDHAKECWITPLRDPMSGGLLGWQEKGEEGRYFRNHPLNVKKSSTLFGWHTVTEQAIAVESPLDAVRLASIGVPGGVAFCGAAVSEEQYLLLRGVGKVIVAFDNPRLDKAGRRGASAYLKACDRLQMSAWFFAYGDLELKDIGEMSAREIRWGVRNARHCVRGKQALFG